MSSLEKLKQQRLIHLCIAITFFTSGLIINFVQLILHLTLKPINITLFRKIMYYLCYSLYSQLVFVSDWWSNSKVRVYMDADDLKYAGKEHVLLIMNHAYEIDWLAGWVFCEKMGVLGNCKAYAKKVISYIPVIGWAWKFAEFVFLERSYEKDKEIISHQLKEVFAYPDPTWLLLNAEGTRFTEKKHEASIKFAQERGMTVLKHHLIPRTKGFTASLSSLRGRCPVIYDISLAFEKNAVNSPTISTLLNGKSVQGHLLVRRIPLENVPDDEVEAAAWLQNLFVEKDKIIDSFHSTGSFFKTSGIKETPYIDYDPRLCCAVNFLIWALFSLSLVLYYLISSLVLQNWTGFSIAVGILLIFHIFMVKSINMSKITKASDYGAGAGAGVGAGAGAGTKPEGKQSNRFFIIAETLYLILKINMFSVEKIKQQRLIHLCIAITFFTSGLIINCVQLILYLILKPINKTLFRKAMYYLCYSLYAQLVFVNDWYSNSKTRVYMDAVDLKYAGKEHVLLMMNHAYEIDWLAGLVFAEKIGVLGNCKAYAKRVISYIPVIGWAWKFAEFVFLERSYEKDKEIISHQLKEVFAYPDPTSLLLNAEGTRFTEKKHEASIKFAEERGMTVLKHHLIPRTKGFTASLSSLRGRCPVIYDINLAFEKNAVNSPTISTLLNGKSVQSHILVRRIPLENVPEDEVEAAAWLQNLFVEKDKIIDSFHSTGSFFKTSGIKETPYIDYDPRLCCAVNFLIWALFSLSLILYYLISSLVLQNWIGFTIAVGILLTFYIFMVKSINMSKISKGSDYGAGDGSKTERKQY